MKEFIALGDGTTSDRIIFIKNNTSSELYAFIGDNGSSIVNQVISGTNILGTHKVAFAYKTNDFAVYLDGTLVYSSASGTVPTTSNLYVGVNEITGTDLQNCWHNFPSPTYSRPAFLTPNWLNLPPFNILLQ
jgi:hypothetical protein